MPRRNLIPLVLVALLLVLALVFAVLGQASSPARGSLAVQNATDATFGSPTGSQSFTMNLIASLAPGTGGGNVTQRRVIAFDSPDRMTVFQHEGTRTVRIAVLGPAAIPCVLRAYTSVVGGSTPWNANGDSFTRDETLADFSARVPHTAGGVCAPHPSAAHGTVAERAIVRSGYLIDLTLIVSVPSVLPGGGTTHGVESEQLQMRTIGGTTVRDL